MAVAEEGVAVDAVAALDYQLAFAKEDFGFLRGEGIPEQRLVRADNRPVAMGFGIELVTDLFVDDGIGRDICAARSDGGKAVHGEKSQHDQHDGGGTDGASAPEGRICGVHVSPPFFGALQRVGTLAIDNPCLCKPS
jgi:hypothetical protein